MRIALICPYSTGPMRGNITTVRRIARGLIEAGADVAVFPLDTMTSDEITEQVTAFAPHLLDAFHAGMCGEFACRLAASLGVPCVITITGSDINERRFRESSGMGHAMEQATAIVCFDDLTAAEIIRCFPLAAERTTVIHQGVEPLPSTSLSWPGISEDDFLLLLPAAIRPVKNVLFPLRALASLTGRLPRLKLALAGGIIDSGYAARVREEVAASSNAVWLGDIPFEQMGSIYARADVVLNCSSSEEMPNSLLEAMAMGRPVLAADIPGNRVLVRDGETGWLYRNEDEFREIVTRLAGDATLGMEVGRRAREHVLERFSPRRETRLYRELFEKLLLVTTNSCDAILSASSK